MSEFLGSRISLISKSDIRYSGVLHEINSEESTVSLENVRSFGTEGRKPGNEIGPSDQVYEYIVFRGSDVKDLRIEEAPAAKENKPPAVPDDPAIVGARPRPGAASGPAPGPHNQQGPPGAPHFNQPHFQPQNFYPPGPGGPWGRGGGPGPGPDPRFGGMPYPPPPGWFPPGQGFPPGPGGPGPWNNFGYPPGPPGPPGPHGAPGAPGTPSALGTPSQAVGGTSQQEVKPSPMSGPPAEDGNITHTELPSEPKSLGQPPAQQTSAAASTPGPAPPPPVESKPSVAEVKATAESLAINVPQQPMQQAASVPTGPKNKRVTPAVPAFPIPAFPGGLPSRAAQSGQPQATAAAVAVRPGADAASGTVSAASIKDATQQAKEAVAVAMAKLNASSAASGMGVPPANGAGNGLDNLTKKVDEMRVNAGRGGSGGRGRGRGGRQGAQTKIEVPDVDFDFETANAKFNKEDLVKEAIAGSPLGDVPNGSALDDSEQTESSQPAQAYNKTKSFFDNISSEARERAESGGQKPGGREWRGEETRKNIETFGQGSVDGGYRGYRGRGRGRGRGGPRGRGFNSGGRGGYRPRGGEPQDTQQ